MKKKTLWLAFISLAFPFMALALELKNPLSGVSDFSTLLSNITTYVEGMIGFVAVLMFVIAGIQFVISGGDSSKINKAKQTAIYAAIGTAVALAGGGLVALVKAILSGSV